MKYKYLIFLIVTTALIFPSAATAKITWKAKIVNIENCRTFQVETHWQKIRVQLANITCSKAPVQDGQGELGKEEELAVLKNLLFQKSVNLKTIKRDNQQVIVYATLKGIDIGKIVIESGFAVVSENCRVKKCDKRKEYHLAAIKAAKQGTGLWKYPIQKLPVSFQNELFSSIDR